MRKAVFGSVLTFLISMIFAALALVLIFSVLEKVFGFSTGVLLGAAGKFVCEKTGNAGAIITGSGGAFAGSALGCAALAIPAAAFTWGIGAPWACAIGASIGGSIGGVGGFAAGNNCK